jgi:hypothetical protein
MDTAMESICMRVRGRRFVYTTRYCTVVRSVGVGVVVPARARAVAYSNYAHRARYIWCYYVTYDTPESRPQIRQKGCDNVFAISAREG